MDAATLDPPETVRAARATINLPGLRAGARADVDTAAPYVATCLERGYLVLTDPEAPGQ